MPDYLTVAEVYQMQHLLIDRFGGLPGILDKCGASCFFLPRRAITNLLKKNGRADGVLREQPRLPRR